jgi:hypothetical protein
MTEGEDNNEVGMGYIIIFETEKEILRALKILVTGILHLMVPKDKQCIFESDSCFKFYCM